MEPHGDSTLLVDDVDIGRTRISESKGMDHLAKVQGLLGCFRGYDVLVFLRTEETSAAQFHLLGTCCAVEKENVSASAFTGINVSAPVRIRKAVEDHAMLVM